MLPDSLEELIDGQQIVDSIREKIDQRRNDQQVVANSSQEEERAATTLIATVSESQEEQDRVIFVVGSAVLACMAVAGLGIYCKRNRKSMLLKRTSSYDTEEPLL